jgi:hypothetical protein
MFTICILLLGGDVLLARVKDLENGEGREKIPQMPALR